MINHGHITWGTSPKTRFGAHLGLWGLPEASAGQTGQPRVGIKVALGKLEQFGSVFWYLGLTSPSNGYKIQNNSKQTVFYSKITVFLIKNRYLKKKVFFVLLHRVPIATGTMNILCCRRGAPLAHLGLTFPSSGYKIQKNSKKPFFVLTVFFKLFLFSLFLFEFYHRVLIATGTRNILCCRRGAPLAH